MFSVSCKSTPEKTVLSFPLINLYGNFLSLSPQVGDKSFPLEAVKQLKKIMELDEKFGPHSDAHTFKTVCANPLVPQVFRPVCQKDEEVAVFSNLMVINMNECEICANPACAGCGY
uniref:Guanylate cyclase activator 2B n=1 Tax=Neolamprologus brichardi TaxID=32507 RepID=A0A3Q4MLD3_NEOBR